MAAPKKQIDPRQKERLSAVLQEKDISKAALAKLLYVSRQTVYDYINCKVQLPKEAAKAIQDAYGYNKSWLLCEDDRKTLYEVRLDDLDRQDRRFKSDTALFVEALENMGMTIEIHPIDDVLLEVWDRFPLYQKLPMSNFSIKKDEELVAIITSEQMQNLHKELSHYARYLMERAIEEGGADDGEQ